MKVQVNVNKTLGAYADPTRWMNSTLRYVPPVDFPQFLESRLGKAKIMRAWITLDEYWDYRTGITYPDYDIGVMRYPVEQLHFPYDMKLIVPAPSGTRFVDYLTTHSRHSEELLLNVRRYEREVSDGIITYEQYEAIFEQAVEYCKELAPNIRYIECCNEVDIKTFGKLTAQEYVNIYLCAHRAITRLNEKHGYAIPLELGGFAEAHPLQNWDLMLGVMELLKKSEIADDPMAFYSYHMYNAPENRSLTAGGRYELAKLSGVEKLKLIVKQHEDMIERFGLPKRPVFLNELGRARATGLDGDCLHNAAGLLTYLIAFAKGEYGEAYPFPWCTFHNPNLQISFTQYVLNEDGSYSATPNGIALEMLYAMKGQLLESQVAELNAADSQHCALATANGDGYDVVVVNVCPDSIPCLCTLEGLEDGSYTVEAYRCNLFSNNVVYKNGNGNGSLELTETLEVTCENGKLTTVETLDRDCFALLRIRKN